jgi:ubiquinone/menaquinone biosynthesis C-methylase UbiE
MRMNDLVPTQEDLERHFRYTYGNPKKHGWRVRLRYWFGYFDPDAWYEATVERLVTKDCSWIDVGGGKTIFPENRSLSAALSQRCNLLVGVDPSDNILVNPYVTERIKCTLEQYQSDRCFELATLRMVAEHIQTPEAAVESLGRIVKPGGRVVVYTPNRWSPVSIAAAIIPFSLHSPLTRFLWQTKAEDVFPTVYRMNTRKRLQALFQQGGFKEIGFLYLDNCNTFQRFRLTCCLELSLRWLLRKVGIRYPEHNLLGVYERME